MKLYDRELRIAPNYPRYLISDKGEVFSKHGVQRSSHVASGYKRVKLMHVSGKRRAESIHRLVVEAFLGPIPAKMWVNHKNGDKLDNRIENLEIVTPSRNLQHAVEVLGRQLGKAPNLDRVDAMRLLITRGWSQHRISRAFGISQPAVSELLAYHKP